MEFHHLNVCGGNRSVLTRYGLLLFVLGCMPSIIRTQMDDQDSRYRGCYALSNEWQFLKQYNELTGEMCIEACYNMDYRFAAFIYYDCWCSQVPSGTTDDLCRKTDWTCPGGGTLKCGGREENHLKIGNVYDAVPKNRGYIGCFMDSIHGEYAMPWWPYNNNPGLTVDNCIRACTEKDRKYKFAGLQEYQNNKYACYCSNFRYDIYGKSDSCDAPCPGDNDDVCGGYDPRALSVYITGAEPTVSGFIDCFTDNPNLLATFVGNDFTTVTECALECIQRNNTYTGMKEGNKCYCGNAVNSYEAVLGVDKPSCGLPCMGNPDQYCGESGRRWMAVYSADAYIPTTTTAEPTTTQEMTIDTNGHLVAGGSSDNNDGNGKATAASGPPIVVIAVVVSLFILIVIGVIIILIFIIRRRKKNASKMDGYETSSAISQQSQPQDKSPSQIQLIVDENALKALPIADGEPSVPPRPIQLNQIESYVEQELAKENPFTEEYITIPSGQLFPWDVGRNAAVKNKNRFKNILAYDHNRVKLVTTKKSKTDYINASYMKDYHGVTSFIASQGPTTHTLVDFWTMIWDQHVPNVVMVTNLKELNKTKCEKYWPSEEGKSTLYGDISIKLHKEDVWPDYAMRILYAEKGGEKRQVTQYHYTGWFDHSVPAHATPMLNFHRRIKSNLKPNVGPTVIHCSAGVGRTGTFLALDYLLDQAEAEGQVDVPTCVYKLRQDRISMVQTKIQYAYIYKALLEAVTIGTTAIACYKFDSELTNMQIPDEKHGETKLEKQFKILVDLKPDFVKEDYSVSTDPTHMHLNREADILLADSKRVILKKRKGCKTDYINAVHTPGYRSESAYVATQLPLEDTKAEFWRMVLDTNCDIIVSLHARNDYNAKSEQEPEYSVVNKAKAKEDSNKYTGQSNVNQSDEQIYENSGVTENVAYHNKAMEDDSEDNLYINVASVPEKNTHTPNNPDINSVYPYWPEKGQSMVCGPVTVETNQEVLNDAVTVFDLEVSADGEAARCEVKLFQLHWTRDTKRSMPSMKNLIQLHQEVKQCHQQGPIILQCLDGVGECGLVSALWYMMEMTEIEQEVDIFQIVRHVRHSRPQFVHTQEQYNSLYEAAKIYIASFSDYANFK